MATPPIRVQLLSPGVKAQAKIIEEAILRVNKSMGLLVTGVAEVNRRTGDSLNKVTVRFTRFTETGQKVSGTVKVLAKDFDRLEDFIDKATKKVLFNTKAIQSNEAAIRKRQAAVTKGARSIPVTTDQRRFATVDEQVKVKKAIERLRELANQAGISGAKIKNIFSDVAAGRLKDFRGRLSAVQNQVVLVVKSIRQVGVAGETAFNKSLIAANKQAAALAKVNAELFRQSVALKAVSRSSARSLRRQTGGSQFAGQATPIEKNRVVQAEEALRKLARTTKVTGQQINAVFADVNKGQIRNYEGTLARVQTSVVRLQRAQHGLGATAEAAHLRAAKAATKQQAALDKTRAKANTLVASLKSLAGVTGVAIFIGAVFRLQQALTDGTEAAIEFSKRIAEVQTIQGDSGTTTEQWSNQLRELSDAYGIPIIDQAEAAYQTLSNQVAKGADAFIFLEAANKLAVTAVTDTSNAVNLLTSVINAFGLDVSEAESIAAKLFKTVELGRVRIDEMSDTLGRIAVPASKLGIRFEELLASIAVTTRQGIRFNEASTLMRGILLKLVKPTDEMTKLFDELGFASAEAAIAALGLPGVLAEIDKKAQGSSTELGKLFNRVRGTTGALIFAGEGLNQFNEELGKIDAAGVEELADKTTIVTESIGKQFEIELTKINNIFKDFGQEILTGIVFLSNNFISLSGAVKTLADALIFFAKVALPPIIVGLALLTLKLGALAIAFALTPIGQAVLATTAFIFVIDKLATSSRDAAEEVKRFNKELEDSAIASAKAREAFEAGVSKNIVAAFKERTRASLVAIAQETAALNANNKVRLELVDRLQRASNNANKAIIKNVKQLASAAGGEFKKLSGGARKVAEGISKSFLDASKRLFSFDIGVAVDKNQLRLIENQLEVVRAKQQAAAEEGDKATFERASKNIEALANQRLKAAERIAKAERKSDLNVSDARADLIRARGTGNEQNIKLARQALDDAKRAQRQVGIISEEQLDVQNKIVAKRREIRASDAGSTEAKALQQELRGLLQVQFSLTDSVKKQDAERKKIVDRVKIEANLRLKLQEDLNRKAEEFLKKQIIQQRIAAELVSLDKQRKDFDLEKTLEIDDPKKLTKEIEKQEAIIRKTLDLQKDLGIGTGRKALEEEIANIRNAGIAQQQVLENKLEEEKERKRVKSLEDNLTALRKIETEQGKIDAKRLSDFKVNLAKSVKALVDIDAGDLSAAQSVSPLGESVGDQQRRAANVESIKEGLLRAIPSLLTEITRTGGTFSAKDTQSAIILLERALGRTRIGDATDTTNRLADPTLDPLLGGLRSALKRDVKSIIDSAESRRQLLRDLEKAVDAENFTRNKIINAGDEFATQQERFTAKAIEIRDSLDKALKGREDKATERETRQAGFVPTGDVQSRQQAEQAAAGQVEKNHLDGAKAQRDQVIKNNVDGAIAGGKALQEFRRKATEQEIQAKEAAAKRTADIAKQAEAQKAAKEPLLTGFAARVRDADKGRGTSAFQLSKDAAEGRAAQRKRNEDFLRRRREAKIAEQGVDLGGGAPPKSISDQLEEQLVIARKQLDAATTQKEQTAGLEEVDNLQRQIKILSELQARPSGPGAQAPTVQPDPLSKIPIPEGVEGTSLFVKNTDALDLLRTSIGLLRRNIDQVATTLPNTLDTFLHASRDTVDALLRDPGSAIRDPFDLPQSKPLSEAQLAASRAANRDFSPDLTINPQTLPRPPRMQEFDMEGPGGLSLPPINLTATTILNADGRKLAEVSAPHLDIINTRRSRGGVSRSNP